MKNHLPDFVKKRFKVSLDDLPEVEHRVVQHLGERRHISRDINLEFEKKLTLGQRLADRVAAFGGSWTLIIIFAAILLPGCYSTLSFSRAIALHLILTRIFC